MTASGRSSSSASSGIDGRTLVLDAVDLVALVGETVPLKKAGRRYVGCCPFHSEKTPSFGVDPAKGFYYCFGCKKGGNAIDFVIERDHCDFRSALETLAAWAGVELPRTGADPGRQDRMTRLREACSVAAEVFRKALASPEGRAAREYLASRGFTTPTLDAFGIGFAPDARATLDKAGLCRKFGEETLLEAGLLRQGERGRYDTFRGRVIFPIRDEQGRPIAFGGRILPGDDNPAKYLNSPQTPLFDKSRVLFGLDLAKAGIASSGTAVVFEGYADAAIARQHGVTNGVAVLGTSLTQEHVATLRRLAGRVVLVFDADAAGEAATRRSVELFLREPIDVAVATLPGGVDPDDFLRANGLGAFNAILDDASDALTYQWRRLTARIGSSPGVTARQRAVDEYLDTLAAARAAVGGSVDATRWGAVLRRVERLTGVGVEALRRRFEGPAPTRGAPTRPRAYRRRGEVEYADARRDDVVEATLDRVTRMGQNLLGSLFREPSLWHDVQAHVKPDDFRDRRQRWLGTLFWDVTRNEGVLPFPQWLDVVRQAASQAPGGGEASASAAAAACIEWSHASELLGPARDVAAAAARGLLQIREDAGLDELLGEVRRTAAGAVTDAAVEDENALLRRLQERLRTLGRAGGSPDARDPTG